MEGVLEQKWRHFVFQIFIRLDTFVITKCIRPVF